MCANHQSKRLIFLLNMSNLTQANIEPETAERQQLSLTVEYR